MRGILDTFVWASTRMIPVLRPRQPREEEMKCGSQSADIRMIHRRKDHPRVVLLILCSADNSAHTLHPFVCQRETALCLLTGQAILKVVGDGHAAGSRLAPPHSHDHIAVGHLLGGVELVEQLLAPGGDGQPAHEAIRRQLIKATIVELDIALSLGSRFGGNFVWPGRTIRSLKRLHC